MDNKQLILSNLSQADFTVNAYLADLTDAELLVRPVPGINHIAWQWGHLISSEAYLVGQVCPGKCAADREPLPLVAAWRRRHTLHRADARQQRVGRGDAWQGRGISDGDGGHAASLGRYLRTL